MDPIFVWVCQALSLPWWTAGNGVAARDKLSSPDMCPSHPSASSPFPLGAAPSAGGISVRQQVRPMGAGPGAPAPCERGGAAALPRASGVSTSVLEAMTVL